MTDSVCKFIDTHPAPDILQTINFVYERNRVESKVKISAVYRVNYVVKGKGILKLSGVEKHLKKGDLFFIFPASSYSITGDSEFEYIYVSFMGLRANVLLEKYGINKSNFYFQLDEQLGDFWLKNINLPTPVIDIASESVVLYTLSLVGGKLVGKVDFNTTDKFADIKKYVDDNFYIPELNIKKIAKAFNYNEKYLSSAFKKRFKIGVSNYLNLVRINHACALFDGGYTGVTDVSYLCGYNDSLYFSKVFKKHTGTSPREYIKRVTVDNAKQ